MKKIIFCALIAAMSLTSCTDFVTTDELAAIVSTGELKYVDTDHIAAIAEAAGRDNIKVERMNYPETHSIGENYKVVINETGRTNCAALLY